MCRDVSYYVTPSGEVPMLDFASSLPARLRSKLEHDLGLVREDASVFSGPKTAMVRDGIFELKTKVSTDKLRSFFFYGPDGSIVFTNAFMKKTRKTPSREIMRAIRYRQEYLSDTDRRPA